MTDPVSRQLTLSIRLLGSFEVTIDGEPTPALRSRKGQWLLALLALRIGRPTARTWLAAALWPDSSEEQALGNLRRTLTDIRGVLAAAADRITAPSPRSLALAPLANDHVDTTEFSRHVGQEDVFSLRQATELYRGRLLEECDEHWVHTYRAEYELQFFAAAEKLAGLYLDAGCHEDSIAVLQRVVSIDPLRETAQRGLMQAYAAGGNHSAAILAYREFRVHLSRELNSEPDSETTAAYKQIRQNLDRSAPRPVQNTPALPAKQQHRSSTPGKLPRSLTALVGRTSEIDSIAAELNSSRMVTLVGPGGIGKTRLSVETAHAIAENYLDGAWFIDLSGLQSAEILPTFVASAIGALDVPSDQPLEHLIDYLSSKEMLLVLDNCEHLVQACADLTDSIMNAAAGVKIIATSREALGVIGEARWIVPALSVPGLGSPTDERVPQPDLKSLMRFDAVQLFVERGKGRIPGFSLTVDNARHVAAICTRLDGIPLAIELAAARLAALSPAQIESRLSDRFKLLTGGNRTAWPRHQTLEALIDWSYDLLDLDERVLLRRLAVYNGGWTFDDIKAICDDQLPESKILDVFGSLLDKSLIQPGEEVDGVRRHRLLETIREFALARLKEAGEYDAISRAHAQYYRNMAVEANAGFITVDREECLKRLKLEHDNMRAALTWATNLSDEMPLALEIANSLARFWYAENHFQEGRRWLELILESGKVTDDAARGKAYNGIGSFSWAMGDYDMAEKYFEMLLAYQQQHDDSLGHGYALQNLGLVAMHRGEYPRSKKLMEESLVLLRQHGNSAMLATPLNNLAIVVKDMGDYDYALELIQESYEIHCALRNRAGQASILIVRGNIQRRLKRTDEARTTLGSALKLYQEIEDRQGCSIVLHNLGEMAHLEEDFESARKLYLESLEIASLILDQRQAATTLFNLGQLTRSQGNIPEYKKYFVDSAEMAMRMKDRMLILSLVMDLANEALIAGAYAVVASMLGSMAAAVERYGLPYSESLLQTHNELTAAVRMHLGESDYEAILSGGRAIPLEDALKAALAD